MTREDGDLLKVRPEDRQDTKQRFIDSKYGGRNNLRLTLVDKFGNSLFQLSIFYLVYHSTYFKTKIIKPSNDPLV